MRKLRIAGVVVSSVGVSSMMSFVSWQGQEWFAFGHSGAVRTEKMTQARANKGTRWGTYGLSDDHDDVVRQPSPEL